MASRVPAVPAGLVIVPLLEQVLARVAKPSVLPPGPPHPTHGNRLLHLLVPSMPPAHARNVLHTARRSHHAAHPTRLPVAHPVLGLAPRAAMQVVVAGSTSTAVVVNIFKQDGRGGTHHGVTRGAGHQPAPAS